MKVAALDLGSNTFLCLIAEVLMVNEKPVITKIYADNVEVVRLGQGLDKTKMFHDEALLRAENCFKNFSEIIKTHNPDRILAMATSAARDAKNSNELFLLAKKYNIPLEIIPGEKEAKITYQGAVSGLQENNKNLMVLDIGGGSTEFIFGKNDKLICGQSFDIGCVRLTERLITSQPTSNAELENLVKYINEIIIKAQKLTPDNFILDSLIAVAGTPTSLVVAELGFFDAAQIDGYLLTKKSLELWLNKLQHADVSDKIKMGIPAGRADVILAGVVILLETLKIFNKPHITVSTRGVRYGVALEMGHRYLPNT